MAQATANTNETIQLMMIQQAETNRQQTETNKQMMIQQTTTMNNFMMLMTRNEERRQGESIIEIQQTTTPTSTITNSQYSQSQPSTSANKRKIDGIADDETTAISTVVNGMENMTDDEEIDEMTEEEQMIDIEEIQNDQSNDVRMEDNEQTRQQQLTTTTTTCTTENAVAAGDFSHQFNIKSKTNNTINSNAPFPGVNRQ